MQGISQVRLPALLRDSMILQRNGPVKIWGWAAAKEKIEVKFLQKKYKAIANASGEWFINLPPMKAGGPYAMEIAASNTIILKNVLVGDVFFCSGQSNMVHQMNIHDITYAADISNANYPQIRQFLVPVRADLLSPQKNSSAASWQPAVGEAVRPFSAVAYFFARKLYDQYKVPIGLINASVGGTPIEAWIGEGGLRLFPEIEKVIVINKDSAYVNGMNRAASAAEKQPAPSNDQGFSETIKWYEKNYDSKDWRTINIPGYWEDQGIKNLDGVVWYRKEINVPASMIGKAAKLFMGRIVDADIVYINGQQVGKTTYQYPQRRYALGNDILQAGKNIITIRVTNNNGKGGFVPDKPYYLVAGTDTVDLKGYWQYKVGEVFEESKKNMPPSINPANQPTALYNGMVAAYTNYAIKGIVWYQGEANASKPQNYRQLQQALISNWRNAWKQPALPFLYVQLPNFMESIYSPSESNWALVREAQLQCLAISNTAMAVTIDIGEWNDIHPDNKKDVGERLALAARKIIYGENIVHSGPVVDSFSIDNNKILVHFSQTGTGLISKDGKALSEFAIAGTDKKFTWANAIIDGDKVIVWNVNIPNPKYVRYAWADNPVNPNLYNKEGLPASPFRTDP